MVMVKFMRISAMMEILQVGTVVLLLVNLKIIMTVIIAPSQPYAYLSQDTKYL